MYWACIPLVGGQAKPFCGFRAVLGHALSGKVHDAEIVLRVGASLFGQRANEPQGSRIVAFFLCGKGILPAVRRQRLLKQPPT